MKRLHFGLFLALLISGARTASAANDTIYFGGDNGSPAFGYSPSFPTVNIGDTVVWVGHFDAPHTLKSLTIPSGAQPFSKMDETGTSFSYVVTTGGIYHFECTIHASLFGMIDSFAAATAGVDRAPAIHMMFDPIRPNPATSEAMLDFMLDKPTHVTLRVFNQLGDLVRTVLDENIDAGPQMLMFDTKNFAPGTYMYVLQAGESVLEQKLIVIK